MAETGVVIEHPNRAKAASKATRAVVVALLLGTVAAMLVISLGAWDVLEGAKPIQVAYIAGYLVLAFFVLRWNRGVLPLIAALGVVLLIFAAVATPGWYDRDRIGFADPAIDEGILGLLTALLVPLQVLLIAFSMRGFQQAWNVEIERRAEPAHGDAAPSPA